MDITQMLFSDGAQDGQQPGEVRTVWGTAVADSADGAVLVRMDGDVVAQPSGESREVVLRAADFRGGSAALPSEPFPGSVEVYTGDEATDDTRMDEGEFAVNGRTLTIEALVGAQPVELAWSARYRRELTDADFAGGAFEFDAVPSEVSLAEDVGGDEAADWQPVPYTLDGKTLTVAGMGHVAHAIEADYTRAVVMHCGPGDNVLPDEPAAVDVTGRDTSGAEPVDVEVTDYALAGATITLPDTYGEYEVRYEVAEHEEWSSDEQVASEPSPDYDADYTTGGSLEPADDPVGHDLAWPVEGNLRVYVDGAQTSSYILTGRNIMVDVPADSGRTLALAYVAPATWDTSTEAFADGAVQLPSTPEAGTLRVLVAGEELGPDGYTLEDDMLAIPALARAGVEYLVRYDERDETNVVELPCTPAVQAGQSVQVAVVGGTPTVIGCTGSGDSMQAGIDSATELSVAAEQAAAEAAEIANATGQRVWDADDGLHVTLLERETFEVTPAEANILMNAYGILLRNGLINYNQMSQSGFSIYDGQGNAADNVVGSFGANGVTLGREAESHTEIDYHSLQLIDKEGDAYFYVSDLRDETGVATITETLLGHSSELSYRVTLPVTTASDCSVEVNGTPATFSVADGDRTFTLDSAPAEFSTIEITYNTTDQNAKAYSLGFRAGATGPMSLAVGPDAEAAGGYSYAGGRMAKAWGRTAYATGDHARAWGYASTAEGNYTQAFGGSSRAQNEATIANGEAQTALGRYNLPDTTSAVIIGNGTDNNNNRSNALTVDWDGNVDAGRIIDLHVDQTNGADYDTRLVAASDGTNFSVFVRDPTNTDDITQFYLYGGSAGAGASGRIMQRTSTDGGATWSARYGVRSPWTLVGSTTRTTALSYDLTHYDEVCIVARYSTAYLGSIVLPKAALHASTEYEAYLGGWGNPTTSSNRRAVAKVNRSKLTPVAVTENQTDRTSASTWYVYAR